jgi:LPS-assembly protein
LFLRFLERPCRVAAVLLLALSAAAHAEPSSCPQQELSQSLPPLPAKPDPNLVIHANRSRLSPDNLSDLSGSVLIEQDWLTFSAESLQYSGSTHTVRSDAESLFRDSDVFIIKSERARYNLDTDIGLFEDTEFSLPRQSSRGHARSIGVEQQSRATLRDSYYTGCPAGREDWMLQSSTLEIDHDEGLATAHNAVLRFFDVPIFYTPWLRFPIDKQRRTGFLMPTFGQNQQDGLDLRLPFYINLAPNYDLTLVPRYMSKRGEQLGGDFRYLLPSSTGGLHGEYLGHDTQTHTDRSFFSYSQLTMITHQISLEMNYAEVSDPNYFSDFGGKYDFVFTPYLAHTVKLTYQAPAQYTVSILAQDYQPLAGLTSDQAPYQQLPTVLFNGQTKNRWHGLGAGLNGSFSNFLRSDSVEGQRIYGDPYLRWERDYSAWFAAAQADMTYTTYKLTGPLDNPPSGPSLPSGPRRALPLFSLDSGMRFDRVTESGELQTLEPRVFYLYVPYRDQSMLPIFDSGEPDFDFPQLFSTNRFLGEDRISDANQLTTAVTTRLLDPDRGIPVLTASAGQIYRFSSPKVTLPNETPPDQGSSDYIADLQYAISKHWSARALNLWSPDSGRFDRNEIGVDYLNKRVRFDTSYRYFRGAYDQTDTSFSVPLSDAWRIGSRVRYSLQDHEVLDTFGGVEYQTCCWALQTTFRRNLLSGQQGRYNNGVYFQIELKGLTHIGTDYESLLAPSYLLPSP